MSGIHLHVAKSQIANTSLRMTERLVYPFSARCEEFLREEGATETQIERLEELKREGVRLVIDMDGVLRLE